MIASLTRGRETADDNDEEAATKKRAKNERKREREKEKERREELASRRFAILTSTMSAWSLDYLIGIPGLRGDIENACQERVTEYQLDR